MATVSLITEKNFTTAWNATTVCCNHVTTNTSIEKMNAKFQIPEKHETNKIAYIHG